MVLETGKQLDVLVLDVKLELEGQLVEDGAEVEEVGEVLVLFLERRGPWVHHPLKAGGGSALSDPRGLSGFTGAL